VAGAITTRCRIGCGLQDVVSLSCWVAPAGSRWRYAGPGALAIAQALARKAAVANMLCAYKADRRH
jgi:hypothetical protein